MKSASSQNNCEMLVTWNTDLAGDYGTENMQQAGESCLALLRELNIFHKCEKQFPSLSSQSVPGWGKWQ